MTIKINDSCIGCGSCFAICSDVFEMNGAVAIVKNQEDLICIKDAIFSCPVSAISKSKVC